MNSKNITILFISLLLIVLGTSLLLQFNNKPANYTPPPPDFESNQLTYNEFIEEAQKALAIKDYEEAYLNYKSALKYYPGNQGILVKMGQIKFQMKDYEEAEKIYANLCKSSPDQPTYRVSLAFALTYQNKLNEAALVLEQAKRLRSNDGRIHLISAIMSADKKLVKETIEHLKRYPIQKALIPFLKEPFFDNMREEKDFKDYSKVVEKAKKRASEGK